VTFRGQNPVRATFAGPGGEAEIRFLSADNPDTILGDGFNGVIVDEAARLEKSVWDQNIRPALADKQRKEAHRSRCLSGIKQVHLAVIKMNTKTYQNLIANGRRARFGAIRGHYARLMRYILVHVRPIERAVKRLT
jgi:hypothetical protein